jgi:uncharacterized protein (TIGR02246 family)
MPSGPQVQTLVNGYITAIQDHDRSAFVDLFTDDAVAWDPYPNSRFHGRDGIGQWWDTIIAPVAKTAFDVQDLHICGDRGVMVWKITTSLDGESELQFEWGRRVHHHRRLEDLIADRILGPKPPDTV